MRVDYLRNEWKPLDAAVGGDLEFLEGKLKGDIAVTSATTDRRQVDRRGRPGHRARRRSGSTTARPKALTKLYTRRPALEGMPLAAMHPVEIKSRDGLTLPSYLTLPPGSRCQTATARPTARCRWCCCVHGGPWGRDGYGYNALSPVARQPRLRGAVGQLPRLDRLRQGVRQRRRTSQWGRKMHDDLLDAIDWAVAQRRHHAPTRSRSWAAATAATPRSPA